MERNSLNNKSIIDAEFQEEIERESQKRCNILKRLLHCIKYLAIQNLALRGYRESLQSDCNTGNLLGLLKLISNFDPVVKEHIGFGESYPGSTSYLSPKIQNEFIHIMASTVRDSLLERIRRAKYYGLMFDSTHDQAHREQMSEVVRYIDIHFEKKTVQIKESFLGFIQISGKDAASLVQEILKQLQKDNMNLQDCRSQC